MLCDNLEGWNQRVGGKEAQEEGDICILVLNSCCCTAKTRKAIVKQLSSNLKKKGKQL